MPDSQVSAVPQIVASPASPMVSGGDLSAIVSQLSTQAAQPLPPMYIQGAAQTASPDDLAKKAHPVTHVPDYQAPQPTAGMGRAQQAEQRKMGGIGALITTVGKANEQIQQRKQDTLKSKIVTVMQAKQNIANATQVLSTDPNKAIAKAVLEKNIKVLKDMFDPGSSEGRKNAKEMAKAFDISFTDMDKNKTPEVATGMAAQKEFKANGVFNADNPQEAEVARLAMSPGAPVGQQAGGPQLPTQQQQQQVQKPQQSQTSFVDRLLSNDLPNLQLNPAYTLALKQRQEAQKALMPLITARQKAADASALEDKKLADQKEIDAANNRRAEDIERQRTDSAMAVEKLRAKAERDSAMIRASAILQAARERGNAEDIKGATEVYKQSSSDILSLNRDIIVAQTEVAKMDKDKEKNPDRYKMAKQNLDDLATQLKEQTDLNQQAQIIITKNPQASTIDGLLGGIHIIVPAKK